ncbi:MAG: DNA recombination protein RmuC [Verrucomicrobiota bacterium]|nr:DNA recombination protein RmuC [Verrucomicrobiota bacterium]
MEIIVGIIGLVIGVVMTWLILRGRTQTALAEASSALQAQIATLAAQLQERAAQIARDQEQFAGEKQAHSRTAARLAQTQVEIGQLTIQLENERQRSTGQIALLNEAQTKLSDAFKALSSEALQKNNQSFLDLAKQTMESFRESAKGDLEKRQEAIVQMITPVRETLSKFDEKIQSLEKDRVGAYEGLRQQVAQLADTQTKLHEQTGNLVTALRKPDVRGRWGELQLKRVVEVAGMVEYCDFQTQENVNTEEGRLRPDMIVRLPNGRNIIVDAKTPLAAYLEAVEAKDEPTRLLKLREHVAQIRTHMRQLGSKSYYEQFAPTPEFVVLFLPGESFFSAALEQDPQLLESGALESKVILATPTTLIALLKAVHYGWRQEKIAENARHISELGKELYSRIGTLTKHFADVGKELGQAVGKYNDAVGSLERSYYPSVRKFKELGITKDGEDVAELTQIEKHPKQVREDLL